MSESTLSLAYADFIAELGGFLGYTRTSGNWTAAQAAEIDTYMQAGYRNFILAAPLDGVLQAHEWSFMRPVTTLTTVASYSTGTVTIVNGVVTGSGTTFPSFGTASGELTLTATGVSYPVSTRDGATQLTLVDTTLDADAGSAYTLGFPTYDLPDDWGSMIGPMTYQPGTSDFYPALERVGEHMIRMKRQGCDYTGRPTCFAERPKAFVPTVGQRFQLLFDITPDDAYTLTYRYNANPGKLTSTNIYPLGGMRYSECILESMLAVAEARTEDAPGVHAAKFKELLAAAVSFDKSQGSPDFLGLNLDRSDGVYLDQHRMHSALLTYNGVVPS